MKAQDNALHKIPLILMQGSWKSSMKDVQRYVKNGAKKFNNPNLEINYNNRSKSEKTDLDDYFTQQLLHMERYTYENNHNLFLYSSSILVYSTFEYSLSSIIKIINKITNKDINEGHANTTESMICIHIKKLRNKYKINWNKLSGMWMQIENFRFIRNRIVHNGGELKEGDASKFNKISEMEFGISRRERIIMITNDYLLNIINTMICFFETLCLELKEHVFLQ